MPRRTRTTLIDQRKCRATTAPAEPIKDARHVKNLQRRLGLAVRIVATVPTVGGR